jgi:hypothetical protein
MANKTKAQKHNENLEKLFAPEIARLRKVEAVASEILTSLEKIVDIDPCGLDRCHLINAIQKVLTQKTILKQPS